MCSAGGFVGGVANYKNVPLIDCPKFEDPLAESIKAPVIGACDYNNHLVGLINTAKEKDQKKGKVKLKLDSNGLDVYELDPGVYCGGINIGDGIHAVFNPGTYIIKDGIFDVNKRANLEGVNVTFIFSGVDAELSIGKDAYMDFTAQKTGPYAGILFMDDPSNMDGFKHDIKSNKASNLLGTFYFPKSTLTVDTNKPVADQSAYTIIVAKQIKLKGKPSLYLNSDYSATDVPVPPGVGPIGGTTYLRQ